MPLRAPTTCKGHASSYLCSFFLSFDLRLECRMICKWGGGIEEGVGRGGYNLMFSMSSEQ